MRPRSVAWKSCSCLVPTVAGSPWYAQCIRPHRVLTNDTAEGPLALHVVEQALVWCCVSSVRSRSVLVWLTTAADVAAKGSTAGKRFAYLGSSCIPAISPPPRCWPDGRAILELGLVHGQCVPVALPIAPCSNCKRRHRQRRGAGDRRAATAIAACEPVANAATSYQNLRGQSDEHQPAANVLRRAGQPASTDGCAKTQD